MIKTSKIENTNSREYRSLDILSYSSIKDFSNSRLQFFKKHILKEKIEKEKSEDMVFGDLIDTLLFSEEDFENRFIVTSAIKPTGQMLAFIEDLAKRTIQSTNENGVFCANIEELISESYIIAGFVRDKIEKVKEKFLSEKIGYDYYQELVKSANKSVITSSDLEYGISLVEWIKSHSYTQNVLNWTPEEGESVDQLMLEGEIENIPIKGMLDKVIIDHKNKVIYPWDLKVTYNTDNFSWTYLKMKYFLQCAVYTTLLRSHFEDYTVYPLSFLVIDKFKQTDPLLVKVSEKQYEEAMRGFTTVWGRKYIGLKELLQQIKYHQDLPFETIEERRTNWTSSKAQRDGNGMIFLDLNNLEEE